MFKRTLAIAALALMPIVASAQFQGQNVKATQIAVSTNGFTVVTNTVLQAALADIDTALNVMASEVPTLQQVADQGSATTQDVMIASVSITNLSTRLTDAEGNIINLGLYTNNFASDMDQGTATTDSPAFQNLGVSNILNVEGPSYYGATTGVTIQATGNTDFNSAFFRNQWRMRCVAPTGSWAVALVQLDDTNDTDWVEFGGYGSTQTFYYGYIGENWDDPALTITTTESATGANRVGVNLAAGAVPSVAFEVNGSAGISNNLVVGGTADFGDDVSLNGNNLLFSQDYNDTKVNYNAGILGFQVRGANIMYLVDDKSMKMNDDAKLYYGFSKDYWNVYNSTATQYEFWTTDSDGIGTDGTIFTVGDGTDDVSFNGSLSVTGAVVTAGTADFGDDVTVPSLYVINESGEAEYKMQGQLNAAYSSTMRFGESANYLGSFIRYRGDQNEMLIGVHNSNDSVQGADLTSIRIPRDGSAVDFLTGNATRLYIRSGGITSTVPLTAEDQMAELSVMEYTTQTLATATWAILDVFEDNRVDASYTSSSTNVVVSDAGWYDCSGYFSVEFDAAASGDVYMYTNGAVARDVGGNRIGFDFNAPNISKAVNGSDSKMMYLSAGTSVEWWIKINANADLVLKHGTIRVERK